MSLRRILAGVFLALLLASCSSEPEPDSAAIGEAIERMHREWAAERRKDQRTQTPELFRRFPNVNLAFEANLALRITSARKVSCRRTGDQRLGHICRVVIAASLAGRPSIIQNMEGRFVRGTDGWQVRDITLLEAPD